MWPEVLITVLCVFSFRNTSFSCRFYQISSWNLIRDYHYKKLGNSSYKADMPWRGLLHSHFKLIQVNLVFFWLHLMADLLTYSHFSLSHVFTKSVYFCAFLQKLPMLFQGKPQHWTDEMAWCDTSTCLACAPLLFIIFQDIPNWSLAEFCKKFLVTSGTSTVLGVDVGRMLPFGRKTGYVPRISCAIWMRI